MGSAVFGHNEFRYFPKVFLPFVDSLQSLTAFSLHRHAVNLDLAFNSS